MSRALTYQQRLAALLAREGETVTLTGGGVSRAVSGVFQTASADTVAGYFDPATAGSLTRPVLLLTLDGRLTPPVVGDTLTRDGRSLTVRVVDILRLAGVSVALLALAS